MTAFSEGYNELNHVCNDYNNLKPRRLSSNAHVF